MSVRGKNTPRVVTIIKTTMNILYLNIFRAVKIMSDILRVVEMIVRGNNIFSAVKIISDILRVVEMIVRGNNIRVVKIKFVL
jgi:hypothetical protein